MFQDVFIVGATGKVGSTLVRQILEKRDTDASLHANPTRVVGVASRDNFAYSPRGLSPSQAYGFASRNFGDVNRYTDLHELVEAADIGTRTSSSSLVFVDATPVLDEMTRFHIYVVGTTPYSIVTANKNPIALSDYQTFQALTGNPRRYGYRCSVMAGSDAVPFMLDLRDLNEALLSIEGCFSGTLGYIASELDKDRKFSEILSEAHKKGYTEPDPRDDLRGLDVARKIIVLARSAGCEVGIRDIKPRPFIPEEYLKNESIQDFLANSVNLDQHFSDMLKSARKRGNTVRYVATMNLNQGYPEIEVALKEVPLESSLGMLKGTRNKIVIATECYPQDRPYIIEAPGAGLEVTARNIRRDLIGLLTERTSTNHTVNHRR
ncbi:hypothetical protein HYU50_05745 [Candidatus Woesearchaeota archaeon]|nr:hypothetical protein [Candidatus Woesearchaeota archaeon]